MNIDMYKVICFLEKVTSGNAGVVDLEYCPERKSCTITWKRPRGLRVHKSFNSRYEMLLYVKHLLEEEGVWVSIHREIIQEDFLPED